MKSLFFFSIFLIFSTNLFAKVELNIGLLYDKIAPTRNEARVGAKLWLKQMEEKHIDANISISFYEDSKKILEDFKSKKIILLIANGIYYYENREFFETFSRDKWILSRTDNKFEQFYLIKNEKSDFSLDNMDTKSILYREEAGKVWLESILYKKKKNVNKIFKKTKRVKKYNKLVLNPFFDKDEISIVGKDLYDSMIEINPQIKEKIKVVAKSKPIFFRGIGFTRKDIDSSKRKVLLDMTKRINSSKSNFEVISFIQIQKVHILENEDLKELDGFYKEYIKHKREK